MKQKISSFQKQEINRLVNIWLNAMESTTNDAGWEGESMLARLIEFKGDIPIPTRNDQSNAAMIKAMRLMKGQHALFGKIHAVIGRQIRVKPLYIHALLSKNYYQGINPTTGKLYTLEDRADLVKQEPRSYSYNLAHAYELVQEKLDDIDAYKDSEKVFQVA